MDGGPLPDWTDWTSFWFDVAQALAVLLAGGFAYWKFFKGRTFRYRLELTVEGELVAAQSGEEGIRTRVVLKNTGLANVPFGTRMVRVSTVSRAGWGEKKVPAWMWQMSVAVFEAHDQIESQETLTDEVLIPVLDVGYVPLAYRLEFEVQSKLKPRWVPSRRADEGDSWKASGWSWYQNVIWVSEAVVLRDLQERESGHESQAAHEKEATQ